LKENAASKLGKVSTVVVVAILIFGPSLVLRAQQFSKPVQGIVE
jgi:hypothetical protein